MSTNFLTTVSDKIKESFANLDIQGWIDKIRASTAGTVALYFGAFFAIGFLFKKYFKFLFGCTIITVTILMILQYNSVINFDWPSFYKLIKYNPADFKMDALFESTMNWVKSNFVVFISSTIGFIIGYKLG